jgi:hypothetical protein
VPVTAIGVRSGGMARRPERTGPTPPASDCPAARQAAVCRVSVSRFHSTNERLETVASSLPSGRRAGYPVDGNGSPS